MKTETTIATKTEDFDRLVNDDADLQAARKNAAKAAADRALLVGEQARAEQALQVAKEETARLLARGVRMEQARAQSRLVDAEIGLTDVVERAQFSALIDKAAADEVRRAYEAARLAQQAAVRSALKPTIDSILKSAPSLATEIDYLADAIEAAGATPDHRQSVIADATESWRMASRRLRLLVENLPSLGLAVRR